MNPTLVLVDAALGAGIVGLLILVFFLLRSRRHQTRRYSVLEAAAKQMHETALLLSLGTDPDEVQKVQTALAQRGLYDGDIDGTPGQKTLEALAAEAQAKGINLDEHALSLFETPRYAEVLPEAAQERIALQKAAQSLQEAQFKPGVSLRRNHAA